ncbi:hypothetical protein TNCV_4515821 [Trichonephila clavipes]|nr:hypothetical protein TNCV_4515821 [Trichonephila clavipes]
MNCGYRSKVFGRMLSGRVVQKIVKGEQEMANAVMDTGAQMPVVRPDVVEGQSIDNRGSIQITSAFGEHEMVK